MKCKDEKMNNNQDKIYINHMKEVLKLSINTLELLQGEIEEIIKRIEKLENEM